MMTFADSDTSRLPGLLIVDSDPRGMRELSREIRNHGWQVWGAGVSDATLEIYQELRHCIDIVLVDLQLPGLQGGAILAELAQVNPDLIRCAMSADISPYAVAAFRRMSDTPFFIKPLSARSLAFTLHEMIAPMSRYSDAAQVMR